MKVMLRADDLGYSRGVNYGIYDAVKLGAVKTVGVMANMPEAAHGLDLLKGLDVSLGLHTNISAGSALSDVPGLTTDGKTFKSSRDQKDIDFEEAKKEAQAQLERFVVLTGKKPAYMDTHAVFSDVFQAAVKAVAEANNVPFMAFSRNGEIEFKGQKCKVVMDSMNPAYDPKGFLESVIETGDPDTVQILVLHPGYVDGYLAGHSSLQVPRYKEVEMAMGLDKSRYPAEFVRPEEL